MSGSNGNRSGDFSGASDMDCEANKHSRFSGYVLGVEQNEFGCWGLWIWHHRSHFYLNMHQVWSVSICISDCATVVFLGFITESQIICICERYPCVGRIYWACRDLGFRDALHCYLLIQIPCMCRFPSSYHSNGWPQYTRW